MLASAFLFLMVALAAVLSVLASGAPSLMLVHAFFALAALPLMLAAIQHFVPVLTRSAAPSRRVALAPVLAALAALLALAVFAGLLPRHALLLAALVIAVAAGSTTGWILGRLRRSLGAPHPGARWYVASLGVLVMAMLCVFGMVLDPAHYPFWRGFHVHLNLFGWIGLTVLGTLPLLLPTAVGRGDPGVARRLRSDLPWALAGAVVLAGGAALRWPWLAGAGAILLAVVVVRHPLAWFRVFDRAALCRGVPAALLSASVFLLALLVAGVVHGFGLLAPAPLASAFVFGFLLPLVTGALAQLLPVWRFPGPASPPRLRLGEALSKRAGTRALLFALAGALALAGSPAGAWLAAAAMAWFAGVAVFATTR